jgi:hypothetical protein
MVGPDLSGRLDPLSAVGGRHADVGQDHVRMLVFHGRHEPVEIRDGGDQLDLVHGSQQRRRALADEEVVLGEHHAEHHAGMVYTWGFAGAFRTAKGEVARS